MKYTGAQILVQSLIDQGVDVLFGYPGGSVINIYDALYDRRGEIRHIITSHEQGAAHAADGYARSTGKTGVCLATSGPGATNLVTGIATAYQDSVPLVAITGNVPLDLIGRDAFQEVDIVDLTNPIVKHNYFVQDVTKIAEVVREAFEIANSGRKGPVLIDIPKDLTSAVCDYIPQPRFQLRPTPTPDVLEMIRAAEMIRESKRPVIYCGGGVTFSDCGGQLKEFAERIQAPVCASMMGLSGFPAQSPLYLGMVGMHGTVTANTAVSRCDLLITVGARFSDRVTGNRDRFAPHANILHIDIDKSEFSKNIRATHPIVGDAGQILTSLMELVPPGSREEWVKEILSHKKAHALPAPEHRDGVINPRALIYKLAEAAGPDAIVTTDVGQHQMLVAQHYPFAKARSFISSCGLGTMGYGLGAANGAQIGSPDKNVVLVTGDGCFHMNMAELAVAVSEKLPIKIFVFDNKVLGMVHQWQKLFYSERYSYTKINRQTDYVKLAEAFGASGFAINSPDQIDEVLRQTFETPGPCVVHCRISVESCVYPIIPPGASVEDTITEAAEEKKAPAAKKPERKAQ